MLLQRLAADAACVSFGDGDADDDDDGEDAVVSVIPFKNLLPRSVLPQRPVAVTSFESF